MINQSRCLRNVDIPFAGAPFLVFVAAALWSGVVLAQQTVEIVARDDVPGSVQVQLDAFDSAGSTLATTTLTWAADDNGWSTKSTAVPDETATVRLTFTNDECPVDCAGDTDRNAHIDSIAIRGVLRQGEDFDRTAGCLIDTVPDPGGRVVMSCNHSGDWVEYDVYDVSWYTIDGGGVPSAAGDYQLGATAGQADAGDPAGGGYTVIGGFWAPVAFRPGPPMMAPYPHDRRKNRYISFDPNKALNDGRMVAFQVALKSIALGSCDGPVGDPPQVDFCRVDRGADDCNTCAGAAAENACINQSIDCGNNGTCTPTGETCVNDAPNAGGSNVGTVWWVGPENPNNPSVHLLVSETFRKESTNWPNPVHAGDCEVVPEAVYDVRAVDGDSGLESDPLLVETTRFASSSSSWWGDAVGPLKKFCGGDIRTAECTGDADCTAPETCDRAWTLPDGSVNFDDVNAALALVAPGPNSVAPDPTWVDLHGNGSGTPGSQNFDPPNFVLNFADIGQILSGFGGFPYKGYDPADCPNSGTWPP